MKKRIAIILFIILLIVIIMLFIINMLFSKTLTCIKTNDGPLKNRYQEYKFTGYGNFVKKKERYAKIKDNERHEIIDKYYDMLKNDSEVYDIKIIDNTIEWRSKTSVVNSKIFDNYKDSDGNVLFSKIKKFYEDTGYTCNY